MPARQGSVVEELNGPPFLGLFDSRPVNRVSCFLKLCSRRYK